MLNSKASAIYESSGRAASEDPLGMLDGTPIKALKYCPSEHQNGKQFGSPLLDGSVRMLDGSVTMLVLT